MKGPAVSLAGVHFAGACHHRDVRVPSLLSHEPPLVAGLWGSLVIHMGPDPSFGR